MLIESAEGTRFIGDNVSFFEDGDLVLIGPNIPHLYRNHEDYYKKLNMVAKSKFIHFTEDFLGREFFDLPEMKMVRRLLDKSALGFEIFGKANKYVKGKMAEMDDLSPAKRLISVLEILEYLSTSKDLSPLLSKAFTATNTSDTDRIDEVFQFIMQNYKQEIY